MTEPGFIGQIMTKDVIFVRPDDTMDKVSEIFRRNDFHHIPVTNESGKVEGILSKGDYFQLTHGLTLFKNKNSEDFNESLMRSLLVKEVMTHPVAKLHPEDSIRTAADIFKENLFHALPVVNAENQLVGIVTTFDLLNYAFAEKALIG